MNGVAVLTVPCFTGQADTSHTGEEVSDIEQTHLTERAREREVMPRSVTRAKFLFTLWKYYNYFGLIHDETLSQWEKKVVFCHMGFH